MKKPLLILSACLCAILVSSSNVWAQEGATADRYLGTWEFNIEGTEAGTLYMDLIVSEVDGELSVTMGDPGLGFEMVMESIETTDSTMTGIMGFEMMPEMQVPVTLMRRDETTMSVEMDGNQFVATQKE